MHFDLGSIIGLAATILGTWLGTRIIRPRDHERAQALDAIAKGAAALVVSIAPPGAKWPDLLKSVVDNISAAAGVPTRNRDAIERAAAAALNAMGKTPGV
jgi:hypothetical protein